MAKLSGVTYKNYFVVVSVIVVVTVVVALLYTYYINAKYDVYWCESISHLVKKASVEVKRLHNYFYCYIS